MTSWSHSELALDLRTMAGLRKKTRSLPFSTIIDLMLNSSMFAFFGAIIRWRTFVPRPVTPDCGIWQLLLFLGLAILFRRIPIVLALKQFIPDIRTYREALFCGHFGPMGAGALFLAMEARGELETKGSSVPFGKPGLPARLHSGKANAIHLIWPVVCFIVLGSIFVHGLSTLAISVGGHFIRKAEERAPLLGQETEGFDSMVHDGGGGESEPEVSGSEWRDHYEFSSWLGLTRHIKGGLEGVE
jgi:NhaP-type Na+/H+ or K+/H+ antiporter